MKLSCRSEELLLLYGFDGIVPDDGLEYGGRELNGRYYYSVHGDSYLLSF